MISHVHRSHPEFIMADRTLRSPATVFNQKGWSSAHEHTNINVWLCRNERLSEVYLDRLCITTRRRLVGRTGDDVAHFLSRGFFGDTQPSLQILFSVVSFFPPDCLHGLSPGPFFLSFSVFVFSFSLFFRFWCRAMPCGRLILPFRQLLSARKYIVSYRIVSAEVFKIPRVGEYLQRHDSHYFDNVKPSPYCVMLVTAIFLRWHRLSAGLYRGRRKLWYSVQLFK